MISHVTLGTSDVERATEFYDPIMEVLGNQRVPFERSDPFIMWRSPGDERPLLALTVPFNGDPHDPGNGQMVALLAPDREAVDTAYALAVGGGAGEEGEPGLRPQYHANYYGAYFRDLDGNKICVVCHEPEEEERGA